MLLRHSLLPAAAAALTLAFAGAASAAPMSQATSPSANVASTVERNTTEVGWRRNRVCHWHHGRRHCKWRRAWVPGVHIHIGGGRHHHHRRRHHRH